jgi:hypothetical protein
VTITIGSSLMLDAAPAQEATNQVIGAADVQAMLLAAGERWEQAGVSAGRVQQALAGLTVFVTDLPGAQLASLAAGRLSVDANAAGYGWFVDATPGNDAEFAKRTGLAKHSARANSLAAGKADLLTTLEHELGHALGLEDRHDRLAAITGNIMDAELGLGVRRNPTVVDAALVQLLALEGGRWRRRA